jgi:hypothetical protein
MLANFTGGMESVLEVHNTAALKKMIKFVSLRSSEIASKSIQAATIASGNTSAQNNSGDSGDDTIAKQQTLNVQLAEAAAEITANAEDDEW